MNKFVQPISEDETAGSFQRFQDLMCHRIREILLVSSLYDFFILAEDGGLYESLFNEFTGLGLTNVPRITRVSSGEEAMLRMAREPSRFDLIITSLHPGSSHALEFSREIKKAGIDIPVVLLTWEKHHGGVTLKAEDLSLFDEVFLWQGDFRLFIAIIKCIEDKLNFEQDSEVVGVQAIVLIEDDVRYYSSFLPMIYKEIVQHTTSLIYEGVNQAHRQMRMRARPKIIHCVNYESAWEFCEKNHANLLGVISDIEFPRNGELDREAGLKFVRNLKKIDAGIPVLLQSSDAKARARADEVDAPFLHKDSSILLNDLRMFIIHNMGFGEFVFRMPDGKVVGQASDMRSMVEQLRHVPVDSILYHASHHHFSKWLMARTEHFLASKVRQHTAADHEDPEEARQYLIDALLDHFREQQRGTIVDFDPETFDPESSFARIGGGPLGGKARGLAFAKSLLNRYSIEDKFEGSRVLVPASVVLGTDVFDRFLDDNDLRGFALQCDNDEEILERFLACRFGAVVDYTLREYLNLTDYPLSVRSSSLLEDSHDMPFAGMYDTFMLPNNYENLEDRLSSLLDAIKRVYASMFFKGVKKYVHASAHRLEEEKMAVILQKMVGVERQEHFYPDISGVARSHNFYPIAPMKASDGIVSIALGLGRMVVEGGKTVRFCPRYPRHLVQFSSVDDILEYSQVEFYALKLNGNKKAFDQDIAPGLVVRELNEAEKDGAFSLIASMYNRENHAVYDSSDRGGMPLLTFAPILKHDQFPLAQILELLLTLGEHGINSAVELEFAVTLSDNQEEPSDFYLLQMRPMVVRYDSERLTSVEMVDDDVICRSESVMGNGVISDTSDIVIVDMDRFKRSDTQKIAEEIALHNTRLVEEQSPYLLIGIGRWGSADPWLGIPVNWEDISGVRVIIETAMKGAKVEPSQGTHFFQNLCSAQIGYFTISDREKDSFLDWKWLSKQKAEEKLTYTRHLRLDKPLTVVMNGQNGTGVIAK